MGFLVLGEGLGFGIPVEFAAKLVADVGKLTKAGRTVSRLDVGERLLSRANAVEPIGMVVSRLANFDGRLEFLDQVLGFGFPSTAIHTDCDLFSKK